VKPHNVMIDHKTRKLRLIDWGLAEFYVSRRCSQADTRFSSPTSKKCGGLGIECAALF
jgi:serine/threonine protein kinase